MGRKLLFSLAESPRKITTPCLLVGLRNGVIPHLTKETWDILEKGLPSASCQPAAFLVPFNTWAAKEEVLKAYGKGLSKFLGFDEEKALITVTQDPSAPDIPGFNHKKYVSVWHHGNRVSVEPENCVKGALHAKVNGLIAVCDGETPKDTSNKRISKSVSKSLDFLDICLRKKVETNLNCSVFGAVEGGYDLKARLFSAKKTAERNADLEGYFLDGFHQNGKESLYVEMESLKSILMEILPHLPESKPRFYFGSCDPLMILDLVELGVDVFESSYAYHMTKEGKALTFANTFTGVRNDETLTSDEPKEKLKSQFYFDLKDHRFKEDFGPISSSCCCYTCRKHTRGYINHLLLTDELLGPVLLMMHNLHHMLVFFETIRSCMDTDGKLDELRKLIKQELL